MGMHGEAWVNTRDPGSRPADRARHALRRSRHRQPEDLRAATPRRSTSTSIPPRSTRTSGRRRARRRPARGARRAAAARREPAIARRGSRDIDELKGDSAVRDIQNLPDNGHLYAAHVINDLWRDHRRQRASSSPTSASTRCGRRSTTSTNAPRSLITSGGLGTMGFALPAAIGAKVARPDAEVWVVVGDGGFQMTMCELATIVQEKLERQHRHHQQRLSRHGAAVAGVLLRAPLRGDAAAESRLRQARRGVRHPQRDGHEAHRSRADGRATPASTTGPC